GCVVSAAPGVVPVGGAPNETARAGRATSGMADRVIPVRPAAAAAIFVVADARSIAQPLNAATPATAGRESPPVQVRVAPAAPVPAAIARLTGSTAVETVLPPASWTATTGWTVHAEPAVPPPGWVTNASFAAGPTAIESAADVA